MIPHFRLRAALVTCLMVSGCGSMLPRSSADTPSPFETYAQAQAAADRIVPFKTRIGELHALGFDPAGGANVTVIPYPDIVARLAPYSGVPLEQLDPGIRRCILIKSDCQAYVFRFARQDRKREGGFWVDFFNVRRVTQITGWDFESLVVVGDGVVLFRNTGGQPRVDRVEAQTNPLGPFQSAGEGAAAAVLR